MFSFAFLLKIHILKTTIFGEKTVSLLEFFFIISGVIILIIAFDIAKKQKFNALHFLVFLGIGVGLVTFSFFPNILAFIGNLFGVARGADVLVYTSIIFLLYFVLLLLSKIVENKENVTTIVRDFAIEKSEKKTLSGKEVFLIRAYNEGKVIEGVLKEIQNAGYTNILVVNDGSTDNTRHIIDKNPGISAIHHSINLGAGAALETGFEYLRRYGEVENIITFDSDGQHSIADAKKMLEYLAKHPETKVVFGSRFLGEKKSNIPCIRRCILSLGRIFTFLISGVFLTDTHNGLRAFRKEIIEKIHLKINSMAYASEFIDGLKQNNYHIEEVPVTIRYTPYSLSKGQKSGNAIAIAMRIIWSKFFR
ncbi:hypothetical protein CSB09_03055 [Candidatus Gracilibacteria bacterium]|nr:MAG: hypothetical protein CSB09_03055 [Candidatus Gracilibacteria bacterium]